MSHTQLVEDYTRSETYNGRMVRSCIDHVMTDSPTKCTKPIVIAGGDSDHLAVMFTKYTKNLILNPRTIKKRNYKHFVEENFLNDIKNSNIFEVTKVNDITDAAKQFEETCKTILDKHAPVKVFQVRKTMFHICVKKPNF